MIHVSQVVPHTVLPAVSVELQEQRAARAEAERKLGEFQEQLRKVGRMRSS